MQEQLLFGVSSITAKFAKFDCVTLTILSKEKQLHIQQLRIDEKRKLENLIQPQIEKLTKQKQEILKMIQKDPEKYQTDNFKIKLDIELKHKDSKFC